jgi:hypothetical protein
MTEFMRQTDAFAWAMESDPTLRSTVVAVILLDRSPDWADLRYRFDLISRKFRCIGSGSSSRGRRPRRDGRTVPTSTWTSTCAG